MLRRENDLRLSKEVKVELEKVKDIPDGWLSVMEVTRRIAIMTN